MKSRRLLASALLSLVAVQPALAFTPPVPAIAAKAYYLTDFQSGRTLAALDADKRIEPASLTKLMTAYLTFKAVKEGRIKTDQMLTVSAKGWKTEGSRMFLDPKVPVRVDDLMRGMIVQSGNDACVTLAEAIAGSEEVFAQLMNREAARLGMKNSHFTNSTGLPDANLYTTTADLGILSAAIIRDFPEFYPIYSMKSFKYNKIDQPNRNLLLQRDPSVDGLKTGHTESAGFNLIASTHRDGRRLISVVVGTTGDMVRADESAKLLNWGLNFHDTPKVAAARQPVGEVRVWKGAAESVKAGAARDLFITVDKGDGAKVSKQFVPTAQLVAPVKAGQQIGTLKLSVGGKPLQDVPVVALDNVPEAGFFGRAWDSMKMKFN
ncbi:D-alanyl-D-alanine carboxypeptidase DacC [Andreprevotia sp. IGB-42]|uniref:D-alanyl-D-alanine carboxypeptidase family protein n=1 Tax=Andreprevotia sp. IGB-42 TaxID=2497473 RepID=UPI0013594755|nr:D-alanyl-D-alanine carboxypeptidase family protein [Andreprevotia sp. IGB-42]KAF0811962.1 D-alanyl-D-alanine carboxypeptidase DacC [Andreprevotia sp. IGB-42]